ERCPFGRLRSPNHTLSPARHDRPDYLRQTRSEERQCSHDSYLPEHVRNVISGDCPIVRLVKDPLFPKDDRHETERCEKSCREHGCLNNRIRSRQTAASSIAWEK